MLISLTHACFLDGTDTKQLDLWHADTFIWQKQRHLFEREPSNAYDDFLFRIFWMYESLRRWMASLSISEEKQRAQAIMKHHFLHLSHQLSCVPGLDLQEHAYERQVRELSALSVALYLLFISFD